MLDKEVIEEHLGVRAAENERCMEEYFPLVIADDKKILMSARKKQQIPFYSKAEGSCTDEL